MPSSHSKPKNYFLNESHELSVEEKVGGGRYVDYPTISWPEKAKKLHSSLEHVSRRASQSHDPLSRRRYYVMADPSSEIVKSSTAKDAVEGRKSEGVDFRGAQSRYFERIGLDLIEVHSNGAATVHATQERMEQLLAQTIQLPQLGTREQARFVAIDSFEWLAGKWKFDHEWIQEIGKKHVEGYIKLQPLLNELEADLVIRALENFARDMPGMSLRGKGRSYLGRYYIRAILTSQSIKVLADEFTSIQSLHPPIFALTESLPPTIGGLGVVPQGLHSGVASLPCVGVVDTAVPQDHSILRQFRRGEIVTGLNCSNTENDHHGSMVASRVVFGDVDLSVPTNPPTATCRFLEVRVGAGPSNKILTESVAGALASAVTSAPDVRVFNMSFDGERRLDDLPSKQRAETLKHIEEVDNFAFDQDVLIVVAAGNALRGVIPNPGYPLHYDNSGWELHSYPRAFNALTCGGFAARLSAGGLASEVGAPSPFTRVGPGFAKSPKPDFCASAGNTDADYRPLPGAGIWGYSTLGDPREDFGTSFAAPLLAREAAFIFQDLRAKCPDDTRPFACAVKALLALTAENVASNLSEGLQPLAARTLGNGRCNAQRFITPSPDRARFLWQGIIAHEDDIVRVQIPVPRAWVNQSTAPYLQLSVAWDSPVCAAAEAKWACRDVSVTVHPSPDANALYGSRGKIAGYPLFRRTWDLDKAREKNVVKGDMWVVELSYSQIAAYSAGHIVTPSQRVAFAAEIWDEAEVPLEPHGFVQSLPLAATFLRLSNTSAWLPQAVSIGSDF